MKRSQISKQIDLARLAAKPVLARYAKADAAACAEAYLFRNERLCGIRLVLGDFIAVWKSGWGEVTVRRGEHLLHSVGLTETAARRAA